MEEVYKQFVKDGFKEIGEEFYFKKDHPFGDHSIHIRKGIGDNVFTIEHESKRTILGFNTIFFGLIRNLDEWNILKDMLQI